MTGLLTEEEARKVVDWTEGIADPDNKDQVRLIYEEALRVKPKLAIEAGVRRGISSLAILAAMAQYGGTLHSVDNEERWGRSYNEITRHAPKLAKWWHLWIDDSVKFAQEWKLGGVQFMFIDTSHEYDQTKRELEVYMPLLEKGGSALFHDTRNEYADGVLKPILEYMGEHLDLEYKEMGGNEGMGRLRRV